MKKILLISIYLIATKVWAQWLPQASGTLDHLSDVFFPSANVGYMGANDYLLKTIDGGLTWNVSPGVGPYNGTQLFFTSIDTGYAWGLSGLLKTTDGGLTWIDNFPFTNCANGILHFPNKNVGYAASQNATLDSFFVYKTTNAGNSWSLTYSGTTSTFCETRSIFFTDDMTGSVAIYGGGIYKTIDGGYTWIAKLNSGTGLGIGTDLPVCIHFPSSSIGYSITDDSVYKTTDTGENWLPISAPPSSILYTSIFFTDIDTGYTCGGDGFSTGGIQKTVDGGNTWTLSNTNPLTFLSINFFNSNTGYACGQSGIIYKYSPTSNINDFEKLSKLSIAPNPTNGRFKIIYENDLNGQLFHISLFDVLGNKILEKEIASTSEFDIADKAKGIYFLKLEHKTEGLMKKIIVE